MGLDTVSTTTLIPDALSIGLGFDSCGVYVVLAVMSDAPLLSADQRLANALGSSFPNRWLGSFR